MKAIIFYWACGYDLAKTCGYDLAKTCGYEHNQEIPIEEVFKVAQEIFDGGLNVMIYRNKINDNITLFVDHMRFQTR